MKKLKTLSYLVILLALSAYWISCTSRIVLHPITDKDFWITDKGDYCMSEGFFNEVMNLKIENKR